MKNHSANLILMCAFFVLSCGKQEIQERIPSKSQAIPVQVIPLQRGEFSTEIQASGTFTTQDETLLSFKLGGIVSQIFVKEGDAIKSGQLLASLDLTEIQAGLDQAKLVYEKALREQQRAERLFQDSVATLEQMENAKTALEVAQKQLTTAQFNLTYSQIRAPKNGFVLKKFINQGQQVSSGTSVLQVNGVNPGSWVLRVHVNDHNWSEIQIGDQGIIFPLNLEKGIPGKVIRKSQSADPQSGTYWVELSPNQTDGITLAAGMFGQASITPSLKTAGWQIPYDALLDAQGNTGHVFVATPENTAKKIKVSLGKITPASVEVRSGLENQSQLIVSGSAYLNDGSLLTFKKP